VIRSGVHITFPRRFKIGDHVWLGESVYVLSLAEVEIASSVCVSQRAFLCTGSHDHRREDFALIVKPIRIKSGSWIAAQAFIGPGVTIGTGAVVSAGTVVLRDVADGTVVRGNPATEVAPVGDRNANSINQ
jgi:putative colanic acid biosynthesis acetyltransferase WcaF